MKIYDFKSLTSKGKEIDFFQIMKKTDVNGVAAEPIFEYLKEQAPAEEYKGLKAKATHAMLKRKTLRRT